MVVSSLPSFPDLGVGTCDRLHQAPPLPSPPATAFPDLLPSFNSKPQSSHSISLSAPVQFVLSLEFRSHFHNHIEWRNSLQMAPLVESFPASQLASRIQYVPNGQRRKPPVDLKDCELKELLQYHCDLNGPKSDPRSSVECEPILRLFRK